jgi:hypothetical protein
VTQIRVIPPMVPPTIAPVGVELEACLDVDEAVGSLVVGVDEIERGAWGTGRSEGRR